jgi:MFS transporter, FHS family, L-fucose permease
MSNNKNQNSAYSLVVLTSLFFMWGFITCMNDILIPYMKGVFHLNHTQAMLIQFSFFGAYFIGSVIYFFISSFIGDPINKIGYKNGIIIGLLLSALGTFLFYPAAQYVSYTFFLFALFILGLGFTLLQITANPYVAIIGKPETASSRLNLSQGFNSLGTTIAPLIGGFLIFKYFAAQNVTGAGSVKYPYLFFTLIFLIIAIVMKLIHLPEFVNKQQVEKGAGALKYRQLTLGMIAIFLYVGGEVCIGSMMISFLGLKEIAGLKPADASVYVAFYWGGLMIGRFIGSISLSNLRNRNKHLLMCSIPIIAFLVILLQKGSDIASIYAIFLILNLIAFYIGKYIPNRTLFVFALFAVTLLIISLFSTGHTAMWCVIGIGLFNSIMWSNIFTLSIDGLDRYTSQGSSLLVMAILGGALLPVLQGATADAFGVHISYVIPIFSYIYIAFYGIAGYKKL